jgi:FdhD protein
MEDDTNGAAGALSADPRLAVPPVHVWDGESWLPDESGVPREEAVTITLNGREFITLLATPADRAALAVGFLFDEGILDTIDQLLSCEETVEGVRVEARDIDLSTRLFERRVLTSGCGKAFAFASALDAFTADGRRLPEEMPWVKASVLHQAVGSVYSGGSLYRTTRGTHAAALVDTAGAIVTMVEDIGRHNAVDKVVGRRLLHGASLEGMFIVVTGRISSDMVGKIAKTPIPLVVSKSVPTSMALEYAERLSLCVVGRARGRGLTVFTHPELIDPRG